jgi:hypothetical protein
MSVGQALVSYVPKGRPSALGQKDIVRPIRDVRFTTECRQIQRRRDTLMDSTEGSLNCDFSLEGETDENA